jgi:sigma-54 dependent transcriptional regulator
MEYPWPGNIRELENVIHRAVLVSTTDTLSPKDLNLPKISFNASHVITDEHYSVASTPATGKISYEQQSSLYKLESVLEELFEQGADNLYELINGTTVSKAFEHSKNNQVHTAKLLGISRNILRARLKELNLIA